MIEHHSAAQLVPCDSRDFETVRLNVNAACQRQSLDRDGFERERFGTRGQTALVDFVRLSAPTLREHGVDENPKLVGVILGGQKFSGELRL